MAGSGSLGAVFKVTWEGKPFAAKKVAAWQDSHVSHLKNEASFLTLFGSHPNILSCFGICEKMEVPTSTNS